MLNIDESGEFYIFGTGAHAHKVYLCALSVNISVTAFADENPKAISPIDKIPVISLDDLLNKPPNTCVFIAIGHPEVRKRIFELLTSKGHIFPNITHESAIVSPEAIIEEGSLVAAGAIVESQSIVGKFSIIDIGVIIDHNVNILPYTHLRPGTVCLPRTTWPEPNSCHES